MGRSIITITEAATGTGKTYARGAVFVAEEFLKESRGSKHVSNLPLFADKIVEHAFPNANDDEKAFQRSRIIRIPEEVEAKWREDCSRGGSGPWDTWKNTRIDGWHIAIDEAHTVVGQRSSNEHKRRWMVFLAELRKRGATIEFITQDVTKLPREVVVEANRLYSLISVDSRRDPFFGILIEHWCELLAKLLGKWQSWVWQVESRKAKGKWIFEDIKGWRMSQTYFNLYKSYESPKAGGLAAQHAPLQQWQKRNWFSLLWWFYGKNWEPLTKRGGLTILVLLAFTFRAELIYYCLNMFHEDAKSNKLAVANAARERMGKPPLPNPNFPKGKPVEPMKLEPNQIRVSASQPMPVSMVPVQPVALEPLKPYVVGLVRDAVVMDDGEVIEVGSKTKEGGILDAVDILGGAYTVGGVQKRLSKARPAVVGGVSTPTANVAKAKEPSREGRADGELSGGVDNGSGRVVGQGNPNGDSVR